MNDVRHPRSPSRLLAFLLLPCVVLNSLLPSASYPLVFAARPHPRSPTCYTSSFERQALALDGSGRYLPSTAAFDYAVPKRLLRSLFPIRSAAIGSSEIYVALWALVPLLSLPFLMPSIHRATAGVHNFLNYVVVLYGLFAATAIVGSSNDLPPYWKKGVQQMTDMLERQGFTPSKSETATMARFWTETDEATASALLNPFHGGMDLVALTFKRAYGELSVWILFLEEMRSAIDTLRGTAHSEEQNDSAPWADAAEPVVAALTIAGQFPASEVVDQAPSLRGIIFQVLRTFMPDERFRAHEQLLRASAARATGAVPSGTMRVHDAVQLALQALGRGPLLTVRWSPGLASQHHVHTLRLRVPTLSVLKDSIEPAAAERNPKRWIILSHGKTVTDDALTSLEDLQITNVQAQKISGRWDRAAEEIADKLASHGYFSWVRHHGITLFDIDALTTMAWTFMEPGTELPSNLMGYRPLYKDIQKELASKSSQHVNDWAMGLILPYIGYYLATKYSIPT